MKVLLLANIGTWSNKYYHVGDEAMFITVFKRYRKYYKKSKLTCLTSSPNHQNLKIKEIIHPFPVSYFSFKTFLKMAIKTFLFCHFKKNYFNKKEKEIFKIINNQNIIHLVGGGHLNSIYSDWLYYSLTIITISKILHKKVFITSHTLGPFNPRDFFITSSILNITDKIILREPVNIFTKLKYFILFTKMEGKLDSGYFLKKRKLKLENKKYFRIGFSIHNLEKNNKQIKNIVKSIKQIAHNHKIEIIGIPHIITTNKNEHDMYFLDNFFKNFKKIKKIKLSKNRILNSKGEISEKINYATSTCDLLITTRYHGLIFALSNSIPCICIYNNKYYKQKFKGALKFIYENNSYKRFLIKNHNLKKINKNLEAIIKNNREEKIYLIKKNKEYKTIQNSPYSSIYNIYNK